EFGTPEGYEPTVTNTGDDRLDSDGQTVTVIVNNGDDMTIDSGFYKPEILTNQAIPEVQKASSDLETPETPETPEVRVLASEKSVAEKDYIENKTVAENSEKSSENKEYNQSLNELPDTGEHDNNGLLSTMIAGFGGLLLFRKRKEDKNKEIK
ncbi:MAG: LPXTG cell wall anchor domain-containing protein, partial [Macrococcus canis]|uniref:LPXTG cell wall anchor domain-containing protein n=1 Tax=Macrococcoides canis TaxID=1855823 RepID=UPI002E78CE94